MSKANHKPLPGQSKELAEFMKRALSERGISQRMAAKKIGVNSASICRILNGESTPNAHVCNQIADYFDLPRVQVYALAGWLDMGEMSDAKPVQAVKDLFSDPACQIDIEYIYSCIGDREARLRYIQLLQRIKS